MEEEYKNQHLDMRAAVQIIVNNYVKKTGLYPVFETQRNNNKVRININSLHMIDEHLVEE